MSHRLSPFPALIAVLLFLVPQIVAGDEPKSLTTTPSSTDAEELFHAGKFAEAEASYRELLKTNPQLIAAQTGLVRSVLRQQKIDESLDLVNAALTAHPDSALLLIAKGEVQFRRGEMADAEQCFRAAKKIRPTDVRAYLGLARLYRSYSLYRMAFDELQSAHQIAPKDIEVRRLWLGMLPRKERIEEIKDYLSGPHPDDEDETRWMREQLEYLEATATQPVHSCRLVSKVEQTETKLETFLSSANRVRGIGLTTKLNGHNSRLLLDTGAGGIIVGSKLAEKSGLARVSTQHYGGIGDKGLQTGYRAIVDNIRIGELEFHDCVVMVSDKKSVADEDGLIGADVFGAYLVDIDLPEMRLKLSPLPKRPEDTVAPTALNSEGEEQANAEQKGTIVSESSHGNQNAPLASTRTVPHLPRDRYIAPEMANWTKVFRFGHTFLIPTRVNDSNPMLFALDTGASTNILSIRAGRQVTKVSTEDRIHVRGLNGEVNDVYTADRATLQFGHLRHQNLDMITLDLSTLSRHLGTEVSGFLGFGMLRVLDIKLDYRDGLADFTYDQRKVPAALR